MSGNSESPESRPSINKSEARDALAKVYNYDCECINSSITTELEGIKLDIAILEGKLLPEVISQNASNTNLLKAKQENMEAIIKHQEEMIHKLSEENSVFKSTLVSLENLVFRLTGNNQENNDRGPATNSINTPSVTTPISSVKLHNLNTNNPSPINSPSAVKTPLNMNGNNASPIARNDLGPTINTTNISTGRSSCNSVQLDNLELNDANQSIIEIPSTTSKKNS
ncbi:Hypothetical predicted protein [Paramuricea clavata]|uniref:Uncharacterized protein n=1 Tax=Paramuricea clavata TaxID=317549 RepID=A0A7D9E4T2_PARCT|nr:Hypothetical predicted protein [Paramuricea clavata]